MELQKSGAAHLLHMEAEKTKQQVKARARQQRNDATYDRSVMLYDFAAETALPRQ